MQMFTEALFIIAKHWIKTRCSSISEWANKCSASIQWDITHKNLLKNYQEHKKTWVNLKCILLSARSQAEIKPQAV